MHLKALIFIPVFLVSTQSIAQQFNPGKKYAVQQLLEDYDYQVAAFEKAHPGLYWHTDTVEFNSWKDFIRETIRLSDSLTETEFLRKVALLNLSIGCAHTSIDFSEEHEKWWTQNALLLPFNLFTADSRYYIYQNYSGNPALDFGAEIISIDGAHTNQVIPEVFQYIPSDGGNISRCENVLKTGFYYYYSLAINETSPQYTIKCIPAGTSDTAVFTVKGITYKLLNERRNSLKKPTAPFNFTFIDSLNTGVLKIATFRQDLLEKSGIDFEKSLDSIFGLLKEKNTGSLVIDLRDNGGGLSEYGAQLISYLSATPFVYCKNQWVTTNTLFDFISYDIPETFKGFPAGIVKEDGGYKWKQHSVLGTRQNNPHYFKGKVYFITNGRCASTTAEVVAVARFHKLATIVGEEAGGCYKGNTGGVMGTVVLPHTRLVVTIPIVRYELPTDPLNAKKLLPDYAVSPTIEEWLAGKDAEMEFVTALISNNR